MPPTEVLARFWQLVDKSPDPDGCWIWRGYLNPPGKPRGRRGQNKYPRPRFAVSGGYWTEDGHRLGQRHVYVCRLTLALAMGVSLESVRGLEAAHTCANPERRCVNPYHLEWQTPEAHRASHAS